MVLVLRRAQTEEQVVPAVAVAEAHTHPVQEQAATAAAVVSFFTTKQ